MTIAHTGDPVAAGIAAILEAQGASAVLHDDPGHLVATGAADVAIGDALGYARHLGIADIGLIPNVALLLDGFSGYLRLLFRPGSENLQRIAMEDPLSTAGVVAGLLLIEKHEIEPTIVQAASEDSIDKILEETDGLLVVGAQAVETTAAGRHGLDLADEWLDVTEGPLPYLLAWGAVDRVDDALVQRIAGAAEKFRLSLPDLAATADDPTLFEHLHRAFLSDQMVIALPPENAAEILTPLFHYAFFHGIIGDIPSIRFLPLDEESANEERTV